MIEEYRLTDEDYEIIISAMETVRSIAMGFDVDDIDRILSKLYYYRSSCQSQSPNQTAEAES